MKGGTTGSWLRAISRVAIAAAAMTSSTGHADLEQRARGDVAITMPRDGERFRIEDSAFTIAVDVDDRVEVDHVDLYVDGEYRSYSDSAPYGWVTHGSPAGSYELYAVALDLAGQEHYSEPITFFVSERDDPTDVRTHGGPPSASTDAPQGPQAGCSIADRSAPQAPWVLAIALLAVSRRRR